MYSHCERFCPAPAANIVATFLLRFCLFAQQKQKTSSGGAITLLLLLFCALFIVAILLVFFFRFAASSCCLAFYLVSVFGLGSLLPSSPCIISM